ncbi:uncharacterized protein LOC127750186 [Frankliniella occidentalis]|uniref:Uncharacterized protein LOC127750186 n=1 Tax=Frankliniella occidentalis TaxID=133901 RepID=A0A9C6UBH4_FRAOC|nr:uncharacterized protein LOC127750186 [Frankliniella occidentalis]
MVCTFFFTDPKIKLPGDNPFMAKKYFISVDKVCVAEKNNSMDAILMLVQICFLLNIHYPPGLSLTFEFIERLILQMAPGRESRVKNKKGKVLLVLTSAVRKAGKDLQEFTTKIKDGLQKAGF